MTSLLNFLIVLYVFHYFVIPTSTKNNLVYLLLICAEGMINALFYNSRVVSIYLWGISTKLILYICFNFLKGHCSSVQITSSPFLHLWICHPVNYTILPHMWIRHTVRNVCPPNLKISFVSLVRHLLLSFYKCGSTTFKFLFIKWIRHFSILILHTWVHRTVKMYIV